MSSPSSSESPLPAHEKVALAENVSPVQTPNQHRTEIPLSAPTESVNPCNPSGFGQPEPREPDPADQELGSTLSQDLAIALGGDPDAAVTLGTVLDRISEKGFGLLLLCLALPSALPIPAPGYSTPFGVLIVLVAVQMVAGRQTVWLPEKARRRLLPGTFRLKMVAAASGFLRKTEHLIRPRWPLFTGRNASRLLGLLVLLMGLLMILPIPLTNTAPAMVIFLIGVGLSQRDGLLCSLGLFASVLATAGYLFIVWWVVSLLGEFGWAGATEQVTETIKTWLKSLLGRE